MTNSPEDRLAETNKAFQQPTITIHNPKTGIVLKIDTTNEPFHDCRDEMPISQALNLDLGTGG